MAPWTRKPRALVASSSARQSISLVAAAEPANGLEPDSRRSTNERGWQEEAFAFYDSCGEIWYGSHFYSRTLSRLEWYVGIFDEESGETRRPDDGDGSIKGLELAVELLNRVSDPGGGKADISSKYGQLMFLAGEGRLIGYRDEGDIERWEFTSHKEIKVTRGTDRKVERRSTPNAQAAEYTYVSELPSGPLEPGTAIVWRFHRPHPVWSDLADAPMRSVLGLVQELMLLTVAIGARGSNRAAGNGILVLPSEAFQAAPDSLADPGAPTEDPVLVQLTEHLTTPIKDRASASAVVPMLLHVGADYVDKVRHIDLGQRDATYPESELREQTIRRIAIGLDMPPEALTGVMEANHWTAWQITEDEWQQHLEPVAQQEAAHFSEALLRPFIAGGQMDPRLRVWYDPVKVIQRPDRAQHALDAHDRKAISDETLREELGFDEDDAPDPEDVRETPPPGDGDSPVPTGPPEQDDSLAASLLIACDYAIERAREAAGARLRSRLPKGQHANVPNRLLCAEHVMGGGVPPMSAETTALVAGAFESFDACLSKQGMPEPLRLSIVAECERIAVETLCEPAFTTSDHLRSLCLWTASGAA